MTIHLQKLSVGSESIETLAQWQLHVAARRKASGQSAVHEHVTRMFPKQSDALMDGGSIYWVIKGQIQCRNPIIGLEEVRGHDGIRRCAILMTPTLIPVVPTPKRPFQGWRYLKPSDAPADLSAQTGGLELSSALRTKLSDLGAW